MFRKKERPTEPLAEVMDIRVTPQDIPIKKPFVFVERVIPAFKWNASANDWDLFAGGPPLPKGIQMEYNSVPWFDLPITTNFHIILYSYDFNFSLDANATKNLVLVKRLSFDKFSPEGFDLRDSNKLVVKVQDDLSARGDLLFLIFQGYKWKARL